jgi:predicted dehydrogenase
MTLRLGILGAGMIAATSVLPGIPELDGEVEVVAIASPTPGRAEELATRHGIPRVHRSLEAMLAAGGLDAIVNLTPGPAHFATSRAVLAAGLHLVTEKPLAGTLDEADELIVSAEAAAAVIVCSPPRLVDPARVLVARLLREGVIGRVGFARARSSHAGPAWQAWRADPAGFYAADVGPLLDLGPYALHDLTGLLGPAIAVTALSGRTAATRRAAGGRFDGIEVAVESDDQVLLLLDHGDARFSMVDATFGVRAARSPELEVFGHGGTIDILPGPDGPGVGLYRVDADGVEGAWSDPVDAATRDAWLAYRSRGRASLVQELIDCLRERRKPVLSAVHARHVLEVLLAAQRSAREGRRVVIGASREPW